MCYSEPLALYYIVIVYNLCQGEVKVCLVPTWLSLCPLPLADSLFPTPQTQSWLNHESSEEISWKSWKDWHLPCTGTPLIRDFT